MARRRRKARSRRAIGAPFISWPREAGQSRATCLYHLHGGFHRFYVACKVRHLYTAESLEESRRLGRELGQSQSVSEARVLIAPRGYDGDPIHLAKPFGIARTTSARFEISLFGHRTLGPLLVCLCLHGLGFGLALLGDGVLREPGGLCSNSVFAWACIQPNNEALPSNRTGDVVSRERCD